MGGWTTQLDIAGNRPGSDCPFCAARDHKVYMVMGRSGYCRASEMLEYFAECALREWMSMMKQPRTRLSVQDRVLDEVRTVQQELFESADPALFENQRYKQISPSQAILYLLLEHRYDRARAYQMWTEMMRAGSI